MEIVPLVGEIIVSASTVSVRVNPEDKKRAESLVMRTAGILEVYDEVSFESARRAAGQLKNLVNEIEESKKAAKQPFTQIGKEIDKLAGTVGDPVSGEHRRILSLLNGYVARLEAAQRAEAERKAATVAKEQTELRRRLAEAQEAQRIAEQQARMAKDEAERARASEEALRKQNAAEQAQLAQEMALEIAAIGNQKPKPGLVPGGRVDHPYEFTLVDVKETIAAGFLRLLTWKLDHRACQDEVRSQLERAPDIEPSLPGIRVLRTVSVSVKAQANITP